MFIADDKWYCSEECYKHVTNAADSIDHKYEYVKSVMWAGINQMVRHYAIRHNDGPAMITGIKPVQGKIMGKTEKEQQTYNRTKTLHI